MNQLTKTLITVRSIYGPGYLGSLVWMLQSSQYRIGRYLARYWSTQDFTLLAGNRPDRTTRNKALLLFLMLGSLLQTFLGLGMLIFSLNTSASESMFFGLALIISYPVVWANMLAAFYGAYKFVWSILNPKVAGRSLVCIVLENQVVRLRQAHKFTLIAVAGSVGKTSTKLAIAHTLETKRRVIYQTGNYNDRVTVPLVLFGQSLPNLFNIIAWCKIFVANELAISRPNFYDIAVVELGTDHPGQMAKFAYLKPDISILTAISPEHIEYFGTLDAVASEELTICDYSKQVLASADDIPAKYLKDREAILYTVGKAKGSVYKASNIKPAGPDSLIGSHVTLHLKDSGTIKTQASILGKQGVKILLAAAATAELAGLEPDDIRLGLAEVKPFAGRMQVLEGIHESTIIDDTYNASPIAVKAALDVLYGIKAHQRIAILGNMNELGGYSEEAHKDVGDYCRSDKLDFVVTIGPDAAKYLAPAARAAGCKVETFDSPYLAGKYVSAHLQKGAVVLGEGSQNGVFAEESLKLLLANKADHKKLVRQSAYWMRMKAKQFTASE